MHCLREKRPELKGRVILQDVEFVTAPAREDPKMKALDIEVMTHDMYTPQPASTQGAKVYYARTVL